MSTTSNNDIARAIYFSLKGKSHSEQADTNKKIVSFLRRKRLLSKVPDILSRLQKIINKDEGVIEAKVSTAEKLDHKNRTHIEHFLKKHYSAHKVSIVENVDPKILGGVKIEVDNDVIDLSIKNRVNKLQEYLIKGA